MKFRRKVCLALGFAVMGAAWIPVAQAGEGVRTLEFEPAADASLYSNYPDPTANSLGQHLFVGYTFRQSIRRALLRFDVEACLPPNAIITSASLRLNCSLRSIDSVPLVCSIHRLTTPWQEGPSRAESPEGGGAPAGLDDPTWDFTRFDTIPWAEPGGDFDADAVASTTVMGLGETTWSGPGLASLVQRWVDDPDSNFGMILRESALDEGSAKRFDSRDNLNPANRPVLTITYTLESDVGERHSADTTGDGTISLSEILRVIQIYNASGYSCGAGEDGYRLGLDGESSCSRHALDYLPPLWTISLPEVLRGIQFYNAGAMYPCAAGEDGWCPGESPCDSDS